MNKKYFLAATITLSFLASTACHSISGNAEIREKIVDCDANLPIEKLHKCIEKEAEKYAPKIKNSTTFYSKKIGLEEDIPSKKSSFKSIKRCYKKDNCIKQIASVPYRYDDFDNQLNLSLYLNPYYPNQLKFLAPPLPICAGERGCHMPEISRTSYTRYEDVEFGVGTKDFIIAKENKKENIYAVALHAVALNKKYLIITNVLHLSKLDVEEQLKKEGYTYPYTLQMYQGDNWREEKNWHDISLSELKKIKASDGGSFFIRDKTKKLPQNYQQLAQLSFDLWNEYYPIGGYRFYEIKDSKDIKEVSISLDRRENPSKIYIKQDAEVYEIDIKH